jgi:hypothetical protein
MTSQGQYDLGASHLQFPHPVPFSVQVAEVLLGTSDQKKFSAHVNIFFTSLDRRDGRDVALKSVDRRSDQGAKQLHVEQRLIVDGASFVCKSTRLNGL